MKNQVANENEIAIRALVSTNIQTFAQTFSERHISEIDNPDGTLNMKIHNVFIAALGAEIQYYTALTRSFDSTLGNVLETLAIGIAKLSYEVSRKVEGNLYPEQTGLIAEMLEAFKNSKNPRKPSITDYEKLRTANAPEDMVSKVHISDYYLFDVKSNTHFLIELKIGGDLDNKKARSEKEALFEQYAILSNTLPKDAKIQCYFATAYNRYGEGKPWTQGRVKQFFSEDELLIGEEFWNFICGRSDGYQIVIDEYTRNAHFITDALENIKLTYLN